LVYVLDLREYHLEDVSQSRDFYHVFGLALYVKILGLCHTVEMGDGCMHVVVEAGEDSLDEHDSVLRSSGSG